SGNSWDCRKEGLPIDPGDVVDQEINGNAKGSAINGALTGITTISRLYCKNRTTDQRKRKWNLPDSNWSCSGIGLRASAGDSVVIKLRGVAQGPLPPAPSGLSATSGIGQATLSWDSVPDAIQYNIYWRASPGVGSLLTSVKVNQYNATGLQNGLTYYFSVTAVNAYGEGKPSNEVSVTPGFFDHNPVVGQACAQSGCHDGTSPVTYKPGNHPVTTDLCEACHIIDSWLTLVMPIDHAQTSDVCSRCHNYIIASGKSSNHPPTTDFCAACHVTSNWTRMILPFDHTQTFAECVACHNGSIASGMPGNHPPTTTMCAACHMSTTWLPLILPFDHSQADTTSCISSGCHVAQLPGGHCATTTVECATCHIPGTWGFAQSCDLVPTPPPPPLPNTPPTAVISAPLSASVGTPVMFDGSLSVDPEGMPLTYNWNIEGTTYTGVTVTHVFNSIGQYAVTLTVSDGDQFSSDEHLINIIIPGGGMGGGGGVL
ncbi:PKD domain-containing protein, partial [Kaarinaea lacus]